MGFSTQEIQAHTFGIISIGSYRIRVAICEIKNGIISQKAYVEKKQDASNMLGGEIVHIENLCEDIKMVLQQAEQRSNVHIKDVIFGLPFSELLFSEKKINYVRKNPEKTIEFSELAHIVKIGQKKAITSYLKHIEDHMAYDGDHLTLIHAQIKSAEIDHQITDTFVGNTGSHINFCFSHGFIPKNRRNTLLYIGNTLGKKIIKILPETLALSHMFADQSDLVIIDLGNTSTRIIMKQNNQIQGIENIAIGIADLIQMISKKYHLSDHSIIQNINDERFCNEQKQFLTLFMGSLSTGIREIIGESICPRHFCLLGGGINTFLLDHFDAEELRNYGIKIAGNIEMLDNKEVFQDYQYDHTQMSMFALIQASQEIFAQQSTPLHKALHESSQQY